jgi:hypothetical protein
MSSRNTARKATIENLAPHGSVGTRAAMLRCRWELNQITFLLGQVSVQTISMTGSTSTLT